MLWIFTFIFCVTIATVYGLALVVSTVHHKFMSMDISFPVRESFGEDSEDAHRVNEAAKVLAYDEIIENSAMETAANMRAGSQEPSSWKQLVASDEDMTRRVEWFVQDISGVSDFVFSDFSDADTEIIEQSYRYHLMSFLSSFEMRPHEGR